MSVGARRPVEERGRLVEERQIRLAPRAAPDQPPDQRLGRDARKGLRDDAVQVATGAERALHLLERPIGRAAELRPIQPVDPPHELVPEPLAGRGDRIRPSDRLVDETAELLRVEPQLGTVEPDRDQLLRRRRNRAHRLRDRLGHAEIALRRCRFPRLRHGDRDLAAEDLRHGALVDALLAQHRQHV